MPSSKKELGKIAEPRKESTFLISYVKGSMFSAIGTVSHRGGGREGKLEFSKIWDSETPGANPGPAAKRLGDRGLLTETL